MPRIAIAGFQHETNVFGATPADMHAFEIADSFPAFLRGEGVLTGTEGSTLPLAGFARAAAADSDDDEDDDDDDAGHGCCFLAPSAMAVCTYHST